MDAAHWWWLRRFSLLEIVLRPEKINKMSHIIMIFPKTADIEHKVVSLDFFIHKKSNL